MISESVAKIPIALKPWAPKETPTEVIILDTFRLYGFTWHVTPYLNALGKASGYTVTEEESGYFLGPVFGYTVDDARKAAKRFLLSKGRQAVQEKINSLSN